MRVAAYTTVEPGPETVRFAREHEVDLVLADSAVELIESGRLAEDLLVVLGEAPCDVAVLVRNGQWVVVQIVAPFGGVEHDWPAIELAAWLARSLGTSLRLLGRGRPRPWSP